VCPSNMPRLATARQAGRLGWTETGCFNRNTRACPPDAIGHRWAFHAISETSTCRSGTDHQTRAIRQIECLVRSAGSGRWGGGGKSAPPGSRRLHDGPVRRAADKGCGCRAASGHDQQRVGFAGYGHRKSGTRPRFSNRTVQPGRGNHGVRQQGWSPDARGPELARRCRASGMTGQKPMARNRPSGRAQAGRPRISGAKGVGSRI